MSLDFNYTAVQEPEKYVFDPETDEFRGAFNCITLGLLCLGMGSITAKNIDTLEFRTEILKRVGIPLGGTQEGDWWPTREDFEHLIGLTTNADRLTDAQFKKRVWAMLEREANWAIHKRRVAEKEAEKESEA